MKKDIFGLSLTELQALCANEGFPKFSAKQLCDWMYAKRVSDFDAMTNLSLKIRSRLKEFALVGHCEPVDCQTSVDGTKKYLFPVVINGVQRYVESVFIPADDRATLCVSCQVGCKMGCRFCVTGQQGFHGNLTAGQIVNQIFSIPEFDSLTNIVFMGMGEPMDNLDAILDVCAILTQPWGLGWSPKRITVSTVGLIPQMKRYIDECQCHLAVSLHNAFDRERLDIMPVQKAYPIRSVLDTLRQYDWSGQRRLSFEYTMFRGLNDDIAHAAQLADALQGLDCRVNLIRFHTSPGSPYQTASPSSIEQFQRFLNNHGITCTLRASRGQDIDAACGLLAGQNLR